MHIDNDPSVYVLRQGIKCALSLTIAIPPPKLSVGPHHNSLVNQQTCQTIFQTGRMGIFHE